MHILRRKGIKRNTALSSWVLVRARTSFLEVSCRAPFISPNQDLYVPVYKSGNSKGSGFKPVRLCVPSAGSKDIFPEGQHLSVRAIPSAGRSLILLRDTLVISPCASSMSNQRIRLVCDLETLSSVFSFQDRESLGSPLDLKLHHCLSLFFLSSFAFYFPSDCQITEDICGLVYRTKDVPQPVAVGFAVLTK